MKKFVFLSVFLLLLNFSLKAQLDQNESCPVLSEGIGKNISIGGKFKPANNAQGAYFKVLIVFVQFVDDIIVNSNWPLNQLPIYATNLIAQTPSSNYQTGTLSDYWKKMSTGRGDSVSYDFIGDVYPQLVPGTGY